MDAQKKFIAYDTLLGAFQRTKEELPLEELASMMVHVFDRDEILKLVEYLERKT